jgi:glyoxylase-like metal-dependent hydrolase (beta-lactamase superfamily II)
MLATSMNVTAIGPDLIVAVGETYQANSLIVLNGRDALLVDAMASVADAEELRQYVEVALDRRVRLIVSTHYFSDHMAGFRLFPDAQIIAHRNYLITFGVERHRTPEEEAHFVAPSIVMSDELVLRWGRHSLRLFYNPGHSPNTIAVDIPEADLVHAGDTVVGNIVYFAYSAPEALIPALERVRGTGRSRLLTSHGDVGSIEAVDHALHYIGALREATRSVPQEGLRDLPLERCLPAGVPPSDFERIFHQRNVEMLAERNMFFDSVS